MSSKKENHKDLHYYTTSLYRRRLPNQCTKPTRRRRFSSLYLQGKKAEESGMDGAVIGKCAEQTDGASWEGGKHTFCTFCVIHGRGGSKHDFTPPKFVLVSRSCSSSRPTLYCTLVVPDTIMCCKWNFTTDGDIALLEHLQETQSSWIAKNSQTEVKTRSNSLSILQFSLFA